MSSKWVIHLLIAAICGCTEQGGEPKNSTGKTEPSTPIAPVTPVEMEAQTKPDASPSPMEEPTPKPAAVAEPKTKAKVVDPELQMAAAVLTRPDEAAIKDACQLLMRRQKAAIPYLLEVYLDDQDQPRTSVHRLLQTICQEYPGISEPDIQQILLQAMAQSDPAMRRGACEFLHERHRNRFAIPDEVVDAVRSMRSGDSVQRNRGLAKKVLGSMATSIAERLVEDALAGSNSKEGFATLVQIGSESIVPLEQAIRTVRIAYQRGLQMGWPASQLFALSAWNLQASNSLSWIRYSASLDE